MKLLSIKKEDDRYIYEICGIKIKTRLPLQKQINNIKEDNMILMLSQIQQANTNKFIDYKDVFSSYCVTDEIIWDYVKFLFNDPDNLCLLKDLKRIPKYALIWGSDYSEKKYKLLHYALEQNITVLKMEDGFLRSADTWCNTIVDKKFIQGISFTLSNDVHYFDATCSSLMERMLNDKELILSQEQLSRARKCIDFIIENNLTKYNHQPIYNPQIGTPGRKKILVVDQSYGDYSISKGMANEYTFEEMLNSAIEENPEADIIIKTHPDSMAKGTTRKSGYYSGYKAHDNIYTLTSPINPIALLKTCDKVYVCSTQFGFEALMCGKEVHVFGMPFYAGWGLTHDRQKCTRRNNKRTLEEIFYIAYILYSHYVNPETQKKCEIEDAMKYLLKLRKEYTEINNHGK